MPVTSEAISCAALTIDSGGDFQNSGSLSNGGLINVNGSLENENGGTLGSSSMLDVAGSLTNAGTMNCITLTVENDCTLTNNGSMVLDNLASADGTGTINNYGNLTVENGAEWWDVAWVTVGGDMQTTARSKPPACWTSPVP